MAIFGMNGFSALVMYIALIGGLYGTKSTSPIYERVQPLMDRKQVADAQGGEAKKRAIAEIRTERATRFARATGKEMPGKAAYVKKEWLR